MSKIRSTLQPLLLALVFIVSLVALAYGYFQSSIAERWTRAQELEQKGMFKEALSAYQDLAKMLDRSKWLKVLAKEVYTGSMIGQLHVMYQLGNDDAVIEFSETCLREEVSDQAAVYFWTGNALIRKGAAQETDEETFPWFSRALVQYRKALGADDAKRWNIRYNYELVRTVLEQATSQSEQKQLKLLRPRVRDQDMPSGKVQG